MSDEPGLFEIMYTCRAMRRLKPDPVPEDVLVKLIDAARQSPSAANTQMARWIIVRDPEIKAKIAALNKTAVEKFYPMREAALANTTPEDADFQRKSMKAGYYLSRHMQDAPAIVISCLERSGREAQDTYMAGVIGGGTIWPAVQNLMLAARALGLGTVLTTWSLADRPAFKEAVGLPENIEPFCVLPIGYPMGKFGPVSRKPVEEILRWDKWG